MILRLAIVAVFLVSFAASRPLYSRWRRQLVLDAGEMPPVPGRLLGETERSWVIFTTPYCATCDSVKARLRDRLDWHVAVVDVTTEPSLADAYRIRSAPTILEADRSGRVLARLVGAQALDDHLRSPTPPQLVAHPSTSTRVGDELAGGQASKRP